jgi:hypothetical protein
MIRLTVGAATAFAAALLAAAMLALPGGSAAAQAALQTRTHTPTDPCEIATAGLSRREPGERELRCQYGAAGPGRFGLSYLDLPAYRSATPMPGTHLVAVPGLPGPRPGESYEAWEWRLLRTAYGPEGRRVYDALELLYPPFADLVLRLESRLRDEGIRFRRRETWRSPPRQAFLFQQGRTRDGGLATTTLTSLHSLVDPLGRPSGRAVDYDVPARQLGRFHELVREAGLHGFGADSHDPGHVFLPPRPFTGEEIAVLRTLIPVDHVSLATGRPSREENAPPLRRLREEARRWAEEPFRLAPRVVNGEVGLRVTMAVEVYRRPVDPPVGPSRRRRFRP